MEYRLGVYTPFGAERFEEIEIWKKSLSTLDLDKKCAVVAIDNSAEKCTKEALLTHLATLPCTTIYIPYKAHITNKTIRHNFHAYHMTTITNLVVSFLSSCEWVLSLESDILVDAVALSTMTKYIEKDVGIIGPPICSRWTRALSCYEPHDYPWPRPRVRVTDRPKTGVTEVGCYGMGFTLIRGHLFSSIPFAATPNFDGTGGNGHEWYFMRKVREAGWKILCCWDVRPDHFNAKGEAIRYADSD